jgi:hypothetical protein
MSEQTPAAVVPSLTLSDADITRIATIVAAVLKASPVSSNLDVNQLGEVIGQRVAEGINKAAPPRKMTIGEYLRENTRKHKLNRRSYVENGRNIPEHLIGDDINDNDFVDLLNRVNRSGLYFDDKVTVVFEQQPGGHAVVAISWSNATVDQRMDMARYFYTVKDAWKQIVAIQEAEAKEEAEIARINAERRAPSRALSFGAQSKTVAEARAKAAESHA